MLAKHNIKSVYHQGKSASTFHLSRMLWEQERRVYTASHVNVARFVLDKAVDLFNSKQRTH